MTVDQTMEVEKTGAPTRATAVELKAAVRLFPLAACCLNWLPLVALGMRGDWIAHPGACAAPFVLFGTACLAAAVLARTVATCGQTPRAWGAGLCGAIGALLALPAAMGAGCGETLALVASCLLGAGMGIQLRALETRLPTAGPTAIAALACAILTLYGALFWLADVLEPQATCLLVAVACAVWISLGHRMPPPDGAVPDADICYPSKLLDNELSALVRRLAGAMLLLGAPTGVMAVMFIAGVSTPPDRDVACFALFAPVCFAALVGAGYLVNREVDSFSTLAFMAILGIATFFPINPGSKFNQHLSLALCAIWVLVLVGCSLMLSGKVNALRTKAGKPVAPALPLLLFGLAGGALVGATLIGALWPEGMLATDQRGPFVATMGMATVALVYFGTNVILTREHLRAAELAARGRIAMSLPPEPAAPAAPEAGFATQADLTARCRAIAFDRGLTPREFDVLLILARGNELSKVQSELVISKGTAVTHRRNIYLKLDVHSRQELLDYVESYTGGDTVAQQS